MQLHFLIIEWCCYRQWRPKQMTKKKKTAHHHLDQLRSHQKILYASKVHGCDVSMKTSKQKN